MYAHSIQSQMYEYTKLHILSDKSDMDIWKSSFNKTMSDHIFLGGMKWGGGRGVEVELSV